MGANDLLYFLYGDREEYLLEAKFSILTALRLSSQQRKFTISVLTDNPKAFTGWPIRVVPVDKSTLERWAGPEGYIHRRKACAIKSGLEIADKSIFIDTDTIFSGDPEILFNRISDQECLMDQFEFRWAEATRRPDYAGLTKHLTQLRELPSPRLRLFNSGVCGLSSKHSAMIDLVIKRIDSWAFLQHELHTIEQIAISFEIKKLRIKLANDCVYHYFSKKPFFHAMLRVFFYAHGHGYSKELVKASAAVPTRISLPKLKDRLFNNLKLSTLPRELRKAGRYYLLGRASNRCEYMMACRDVWWQKCVKEISGIQGQVPTLKLKKLVAGDASFENFIRLYSVAL